MLPFHLTTKTCHHNYLWTYPQMYPFMTLPVHFHAFILNLFDAVAEFATCCGVVKLNKMKWGYEIERKIFHLLHGVVVFNIWLLFFNGNIISDLLVCDAWWYILGKSCKLLQSCEPTMTVKGSTDTVPSCQLQAWIHRRLAFPAPCEGSRQLFLYQGEIIMYSVTYSNYTMLMFHFYC